MSATGYIDGAIWRDTDWRGLTVGQQHLYLLLLSQPDLGPTGLLALSVRRWARYTADRGPDDLRADLDALHAARFIVMDDETEEVLVRSKIRRDGVWKFPNAMLGAQKNVREIESPAIRRALLDELLRVRTMPDLNVKCRETLEAIIGYLSALLGRADVGVQQAAFPVDDATTDPITEPFDDGIADTIADGSTRARPHTHTHTRTPTTTTDTAPQAALDVPDTRPTFDDFWSEVRTADTTGEAWPKANKIDARKVWDTKTRKTDPAVIIAGAVRYREDPNRRACYTRQPDRWLRAESWDNDPLPPRDDPPANGRRAPRGANPFAAHLTQQPGAPPAIGGGTRAHHAPPPWQVTR